METLDGFILNLFRAERPILTYEDFESEDAWICDLLNQDVDTANEFVKYKLSKCTDRIEKLQFLYSSRSCFKYTIEGLEEELDPNYKGEFSYYRDQLSKDQMLERLARYKKALATTNQAICYYIDCSKIDCDEKAALKLSDQKGTKIDVIRIFNALYELRLVTNKDGTLPTKRDFMTLLGKYIGTDLSNYHTGLSQALKNQSLESNLQVFEKMKQLTQEAHYAT